MVVNLLLSPFPTHLPSPAKTSTGELAAHLAHFRGRHDSDLYLGERYGYRLLAADGFNYITGGAGIVFARALVERLAATCVCPSSSAPDDMIVGMCLRQLGVEPVHSERFHQARPGDYAAALLAASRPISFHKFWQLDPVEMYERWLTNERTVVASIKTTTEQIKTTATAHWEL